MGFKLSWYCLFEIVAPNKNTGFDSYMKSNDMFYSTFRNFLSQPTVICKNIDTI